MTSTASRPLEPVPSADDAQAGAGTQAGTQPPHGPARAVGDPAPAGDTATEPSFEEAYRELNEIVVRLESGGLTLDEALALHARGVALADRCNALLESAELRIREVDASGADTGPVALDG